MSSRQADTCPTYPAPTMPLRHTVWKKPASTTARMRGQRVRTMLEKWPPMDCRGWFRLARNAPGAALLPKSDSLHAVKRKKVSA